MSARIPSHPGLHLHSTEEIESEIRRREQATDAEKVLAALSGTWEVVGFIAARAGLPRRQCVDALRCLAITGNANWKPLGGSHVWRLAE